MYGVHGTFRTHTASGHLGPTTVSELRAADPCPVRSFTDLVRHTAQIAALRHDDLTFFRGQREDWRNRGGRTTVYASLYRPEPGRTSLSAASLAARRARMDAGVAVIRRRADDLGRANPLWRYREYATALLQHYELCPTPMVDLTLSLHVAASFARGPDGLGAGVLLVFALPYPTETLSLYPRLGMSLARLQSLCPADARRPQFQEGWLVGRMPLTADKTPEDDLAHRLVAKYALPAGPAFWDGGFQPVPQAALLPTDDPFRDRLVGALTDAGWR